MKKILLFCVVTMMAISVSWAQRTVTGTVTGEEDGTPVPGVNVIVKGTSGGTVTDIDGKYQIGVPEDGGILVFSFIGLATEEVDIGNQSVIDMVMTADIKQLEEIVVTALGQESNKASIGYSIQNVDNQELVEARETNIVNALNSKVAGVSVVSSAGTPGASSNIRIRGNVSISGSNSPLFVIDGVPIDNSQFGGDVDGVNRSNRAIDLNPNDVASMTVLKGPAATVLYGIRAANGAIIVTTKKGSKGKAKVTYSGTYRLDQVNKLPPLQNTYAQGRAVNGELTWRGPDSGEGNSWGPKISDLEFDGSDYPFDENGRLVPRGTGNGRPARAYDNLDNFYVDGITYDNNLSIAGGDGKINYYVSAGHLHQTGVIPKADFSRTTILGKVDAELSDKWKVGISANYINSGGYRVQQGSNTSGISLTLFRNTPTFDVAKGYTNGRDAANDRSVYQFDNGDQRSYRGGVYDSPFWVVNKAPFEDNVHRIIGNTSLQFKATENLSFSYKLGIDYYSEQINSAFDINSATLRDGQVNQVARNSRNLNSTFLVNYNTTFGDNFGLTLTGGHEFFSVDIFTQQTLGTELNVPGFYHISNANTIQGFQGITEKQVHGVLGTATLSWDETVFLNVSGRNDWSSILDPDNNSFFYPSASLGWVFTESLGMSGSSTLSFGKLRASYGQVGNDGGLAFVYSTDNYYSGADWGGDGFISTDTQFPAFGVNAFDRNNLLGNSKLKAELTTTLEFGVDLQFFNGRLGLDLTYFDALTTDAIIAVDLPPSTGNNSFVQNAAEISNKGWEAVISATPIELNNGFSWDMNFNFTAIENVVEKLAPGVETISLEGFVSTTSRAVAGEPFGSIYGAKFLRNGDGKLVVDGNTGWPIQDPVEGVIGDPNPDWLLGFRNTFSYKGLRLSALLDIRQGGDMWNGTYGVLKTFGMAEITGEQREIKGYVFDGVVNTGTDENPVYVENDIPVDFYDPNTGVGQNKWNRYAFGGLPEENMQDASWVRLREVSLSYSMPSSVLRNVFLEDVTFSLMARNLALWTEYNGIDPETNLTGATNGIGLDYFNNPNTRSFNFTLNVTF
jgi:TonB-linked SusC/RagA family outer membrane protein